MNILYVTFSFSVGGIERLLVDIVNTLQMDKKNNIYLCIINNNYDKQLLKEINKDVKVILLNRPVGGNRLKYIIKYTNMIIKNKIDVIHCQMENAVKFSILAKIIKPKLKIFTTVHDTDFEKLKKYEVIIDRIFCDKIIAISDTVKEDILNSGIPHKKVVTIYNAIDIRKFNSSKIKKFDENNIVIGNVSRLMPSKKGQDILIKAIAKVKKKHPNIKCLFAGGITPQEPNALEDLKKICNSLNVKDNISFLGNVEDVPGFLDKIDIFVLPSRYEGFGISLIEAMAKGVPCIAANREGPKEIIKDNKYGILFENDDEDDLARKIEFRIKNIDFNKDLIKEYVNKNFEINSMKDNLVKLYKS